MNTMENDYTCKKKDCYHCYMMNIKPRMQTIPKPIYVVNPKDKKNRIWLDYEIEIMTANIQIGSSYLIKLIPRHTIYAINTRKSILAKRLGIKLKGRWGSFNIQ